MELTDVATGLEVHEIAGKISPETKRFLSEAFASGNVDDERCSAFFAKINCAEQQEVFNFLFNLDEEAGRNLSAYHVSQSLESGDGYVDAVSRCIVIMKLLKAISPFVGIFDRTAFYDDHISAYRDLIVNYKYVKAARASIVGSASAVVPEDSGLQNG